MCFGFAMWYTVGNFRIRNWSCSCIAAHLVGLQNLRLSRFKSDSDEVNKHQLMVLYFWYDVILSRWLPSEHVWRHWRIVCTTCSLFSSVFYWFIFHSASMLEPSKAFTIIVVVYFTLYLLPVSSVNRKLCNCKVNWIHWYLCVRCMIDLYLYTTIVV